jgi:hypothetical protein
MSGLAAAAVESAGSILGSVSPYRIEQRQTGKCAHPLRAKAGSMSGIGHITLNVSVTYCNYSENKPSVPVPAGRELWQKSHNLPQTDGLAQFRLVWVRGGRFCYAIAGYQF